MLTRCCRFNLPVIVAQTFGCKIHHQQTWSCCLNFSNWFLFVYMAFPMLWHEKQLFSEKNKCSNLTQTCCLFSISNFIFMLKHLKVSWKVCLRFFSIRTLWKAPTTLPHRNTTALENSYRKREPEVRPKRKAHFTYFSKLDNPQNGMVWFEMILPDWQVWVCVCRCKSWVAEWGQWCGKARK